MRLLMSFSDQDEGEMKIFANWILDVGNGNIGSVVGDESEVEIPDDLLITTTDDPLSHLVDFAYPNLLQNMSDYSNVIGATVVTGRNIGDKVYILKMNLIPSDSGLPFKFQRRQFSLTVCFAMTINMSQGQSLSHVRLYLPKSVLTHGQLYVALSRVKSRSGLSVLILNEDGNPKSSTTNIVFKKVFNNI
ncbi:uncharacterized protein LOC107478492 [Arachis duranensis]|uniref:Uncharacterized protein LOC107478492 n=1 Tax=Arachis duranensis TaxID=130453 RepID=A0A6P4CSM6_ARADU|nr:uncharacterized protein LOC107478492 [Arachis duranensis]